MCLKTDTIILQYTFYQFQYFIKTCHVRWKSIKKCFSHIVLTVMTCWFCLTEAGHV